MIQTQILIGIDEAGRGPWCGPVVACALAWNPDKKPSKKLMQEVGDSKKITAKKKREII